MRFGEGFSALGSQASKFPMTWGGGSPPTLVRKEGNLKATTPVRIKVDSEAKGEDNKGDIEGQVKGLGPMVERASHNWGKQLLGGKGEQPMVERASHNWGK